MALHPSTCGWLIRPPNTGVRTLLKNAVRFMGCSSYWIPADERLRERAADLDCGMLAYLLAMAEDEARDQLPRNLQLS